MLLFKQTESLQKYLIEHRKSGRSISYVPTMGALHPGHMSLIALSKSSSDITIASIFVNPTQFNDVKDFEKYPVTLDHDILMLETSLCDALFLPSVKEIYPNGLENVSHYPLGELEFLLDGTFRPEHFQGVCQVVDRLLHIVHPTKLFLGQKDFQQQVIIKMLVAYLQLPIEVLIAPTLREHSGLAMSSRNLRLSPDQKNQAKAIYEVLLTIKENFSSANFLSLEKQGADFLLNNGFDKVDYVKIVNAETLKVVKRLEGTLPLVAMVAAFIGGVRLIDNIILTGNNVGKHSG